MSSVLGFLEVIQLHMMIRNKPSDRFLHGQQLVFATWKRISIKECPYVQPSTTPTCYADLLQHKARNTASSLTAEDCLFVFNSVLLPG
jgi:hypothetical protein